MEPEAEKNLWAERDPAGGCRVLSVSPEGAGETLAVTLTLPATVAKAYGLETASPAEPAARVKLHILVEQYAELDLRRGELTAEQAEAVLEAGRLCDAIRRGLSLLQYGDQSPRQLARKLTARGISRDTAAAAVEYLSEKGYVREDDTARLRAEQGVRKLWGPHRIREDLRAHGFSPDATEEALEGLAEVDWIENCAAAIRKRYGEIPSDRQQRQKLMAAVLRLGYDSETVKDALRLILGGK